MQRSEGQEISEAGLSERLSLSQDAGLRESAGSQMSAGDRSFFLICLARGAIFVEPASEPRRSKDIDGDGQPCR